MSNLDPGQGRPNRAEANTPADMASRGVEYLIQGMPVVSFEDDGEAINTRSFCVQLKDGSVLTAIRSQWPDRSTDYLRVISVGDGATEVMRWNADYPLDEFPQAVENFIGADQVFQGDIVTDENWRWANEKLHEALVIKLANSDMMRLLVHKVHGRLPHDKILHKISWEMMDVCQLTGLNPVRTGEIWDIAAQNYTAQRQEAADGQA